MYNYLIYNILPTTTQNTNIQRFTSLPQYIYQGKTNYAAFIITGVNILLLMPVFLSTAVNFILFSQT